MKTQLIVILFSDNKYQKYNIFLIIFQDHQWILHLIFQVMYISSSAWWNDIERSNGKWKFVIAENGLERDRTTEEGRGIHCDEIAETQGGFFMDPKKREEVAQKLPKYKAITFPGV